MKKNILITGGAGFIGSHLVKLFVKKYPYYNIINLDKLTYAGDTKNISEIENFNNYHFVKGDISDSALVYSFNEFKFDTVINLAESHVDNSISNPNIFATTNIMGTLTLLNAFKDFHKNDFQNKVFFNVSTDEVYGSLGSSGYFSEKSKYNPNSPYSASKASSDHFVRAYGETYNIPYLISNCSNNYGSYQYPEKLIPLFINNILIGKELPVYGDGNFIRGWLYVKDHVDALDLILHKSKPNETYNIGGNNELKNIDMVKIICDIMDTKLGQKKGESFSLVKFVDDRPGHDFRYAIDASKIKSTLGWHPKYNFEKGLTITIDWYLNNKDWFFKR